MNTVKKAVITAAGRGTRQFPATQTVQKELFPLVDTDGFAKPVLQIIVEETLASGIENVCVVANPANVEPMRRHFRGLSLAQKQSQFGGKEWALALSDALADMESRLTFVVQERQEGFGDAVLQAREWAAGEPFLLMLGDHVYRSHTQTRCARQGLDAFARQGCAVSSVSSVPEKDVARYGIVRGTALPDTSPPLYAIDEIVEKPTLADARTRLRTPGLPEGEYLTFFGIHVFEPSLFTVLQEQKDTNKRERGEFQLASAQQTLHQRERYLVCGVDGERYDMGIPEGLAETQLALALHSPHAAGVRALFERLEQQHKETQL